MEWPNGTHGARFTSGQEKGPPVKKILVSFVAAVFALGLGIALLSPPSSAVAHPGNTCNPSAGHGRSGCHRVTSSSSTAAAKAAAARRAAAARAAAARRVAAVKHAAAVKAAKRRATAKAKARAAAEASAAAAAAAAVPVAPPVVAAPPAAPVAVAAAPVPWWVAVWRFFTGAA